MQNLIGTFPLILNFFFSHISRFQFSLGHSIFIILHILSLKSPPPHKFYHQLFSFIMMRAFSGGKLFFNEGILIVKSYEINSKDVEIIM